MVEVTCFISPAVREFKAQILLLCCCLLVRIPLYSVVLTFAYFGSDRNIISSFPSQTLVMDPCSLTIRFIFSRKSGMR